jgi:hypothetical protein
MANFTKGRNFSSTEELTNTKLHQLVEDASMNVTAITSLTSLADPVADTDTLPIADDSATAIRKVAASNFLKKNSSSVFDAGTTKITGVATPTVGSDAATKTYADTKVSKTGDTLSGSIDMGSNKIISLGTPTAGTDAATKTYADTKVSKSGDTMSGVLDMGSSKITNLGTPTASGDATTKAYVDSIAVVAGNLPNVNSTNNGSLLAVSSGAWTTKGTDAVSTSLIQNLAVTGAKMEDTGVVAGTYGGSGAIPQITIDAKGRITSALAFSVGAAGGMFFENDITLNSNYTITASKNAMTAGAISIANGVTATVPSGSTWTIV